MIRLILIFTFIFSFLNAQQFNDVNELFEKYKIRKTIETLEALKKLYPINSSPYIKIQKLENYFMRNMPISPFSYYVRLKLHNIINNVENNYETRKKMISEKNEILSPDTDLNALYMQKKIKIKKIKDKNQLIEQTLSNNPNINKENLEEFKSFMKMKQFNR